MRRRKREEHPLSIAELTVAKLDSTHDRRSFDCGNESLNEWIIKYALQNQDTTAVIHVAQTPSGRVVGYYALAAGSVSRAEAIGRVAKDAPDPVPAIRLGRFAVHVDYQGQGLGRELLHEALLGCLSVSEEVGAKCVLVDAADARARNFYERYGFQRSPVHPHLLMLLMKDIRKVLRA